MVRTKRARKVTESQLTNNNDFLRNVVQKMLEQKSTGIKAIDFIQQQMLRELKIAKIEVTGTINPNLMSKTVAEAFVNFGTDASGSTLNGTSISKLNKSKKNALVRSSSFALADDEGYLTAETTGASSGGRQSRSQMKQKTKRLSRSLSQSVMKKQAKYKTPANRKLPPNSYGTVTPKVNPRTPQTILRRPNQGEMAISMQGSPLLTGSITSDTRANVNIPLPDGRVLSIQPERGFRQSQLPPLDSDTFRQIQALRDNLNKVCANMARF